MLCNVGVEIPWNVIEGNVMECWWNVGGMIWKDMERYGMGMA